MVTIIHKEKQKNYVNFVDFFKKMSIINFRMDTQKELSFQDLSVLAEQRVVVGAKQLRKALSAGRASRVFFARNADPAVTEPLVEKCRDCSVEVSWVKSMSDLGRACGIDIGAAAAAIVSES